jgi:hypothetical protein
MSAALTTPVALIIFNRPETTARVFAEIARARPSKMLVIADGPRVDHPEDVEKCDATRAIVERVDWPCEVLTNFSDVNLGCKMRPVSGINWVFENVEDAIILEDDCLAHPSFFRFCEELLELYRHDERVMMIAGTNLLGEWKSKVSYYFSYFGGTWGWATWKRAWQFFDADLKDWPKIAEAGTIESILANPRHAEYWRECFQKVYDGTIREAWDYQWLLACWLQSGFRILPAVNLVSNIGHGDQATHTFEVSKIASMATAAMAFPLRHPRYMVRSVELDDLLQDRIYVPSNRRFISRLMGRS